MSYKQIRQGVLLAVYIVAVIPVIILALPSVCVLMSCVAAFNLLNKLVD
jgi:hypothetical protein